MGLFKSPFEVRIGGNIITNVTDFVYENKKLKINFLIDNKRIAQDLANNQRIEKVRFIGCSSNESNMVTYYIRKDYEVKIEPRDFAILQMSLILDVSFVEFSE